MPVPSHQSYRNIVILSYRQTSSGRHGQSLYDGTESRSAFLLSVCRRGTIRIARQFCVTVSGFQRRPGDRVVSRAQQPGRVLVRQESGRPQALEQRQAYDRRLDSRQYAFQPAGRLPEAADGFLEACDRLRLLLVRLFRVQGWAAGAARSALPASFASP